LKPKNPRRTLQSHFETEIDKNAKKQGGENRSIQRTVSTVFLKIEVRPVSYLDSLRVFVRVVARGSISAGGRDLRLTPAAASNRIKDLESRFGVRLLNRTTRKLAPTEIGAALYESARKVIAALDETEAMLASYSGTPQGVLRVVAPWGSGAG
jgi:hypothetical protein